MARRHSTEAREIDCAHVALPARIASAAGTGIAWAVIGLFGLIDRIRRPTIAS